VSRSIALNTIGSCVYPYVLRPDACPELILQLKLSRFPHTTLAASRRIAGARTCTRPAHRRYPNPSRPRGLPTVRTMPNASCPALLAALSFPLTTNLSNLLFGDVPTALQVLARTAGCLTVPTARDAFLTARKSHAPTTCRRCARRTTISPAAVALPRPTEGLTFSLAGGGGDSGSGSGAAPSPWNSRVLGTLTTTAQDYLQSGWKTFGDG